MDPAHLLIVEDDASLRLVLADNLEEEGYRVSATASGDEAKHWLLGEGEDGERLAADLVILDIMLPDADGYALCRELRRRGLETPILMLTARTLEDDLVDGFDAGADDFLTKPYRLRELLARVRALLRRPRRAAGKVFRFDGFRLDLAARTLRDPRGAPVELTRTELDLLALSDEVWGRDVVVDGRTVDNFVSSLKKKLGWRRSSRFRFATLRGVGYRMEVEG